MRSMVRNNDRFILALLFISFLWLYCTVVEGLRGGSRSGSDDDDENDGRNSHHPYDTSTTGEMSGTTRQEANVGGNILLEMDLQPPRTTRTRTRRKKTQTRRNHEVNNNDNEDENHDNNKNSEKPSSETAAAAAAAETRRTTTVTESLTLDEPVRQPRIVGGNNANRNDYPFFVEWDGCGGTLIHRNIVLTAAHCLNQQFFNATVSVGAYRSDQVDGIQSKVVGLAFHPKFVNTDPESFSFDFALMVLEEPGIDPSMIEPVPLNRNPNHPKDEEKKDEELLLTVIGLGLTSTDQNAATAKKLQQLSVPYVPFKDCQKEFDEPLDEESMFCAGGKNGEDACLGDSGGPILDESGTQLGVVSFGIGCGDRIPGVYSRIVGVTDWIDEFICVHSTSTTICSSSSPSSSLSSSSSSSSSFPPVPRFPIEIMIHHDTYPYETSWNVWDDSIATSITSERSTFFVPRTIVMQPGSVTKKTFNLRPGNYTFQIIDAVGDGLCCNYGFGNYTISSSAVAEAVTTENGESDHNDDVYDNLSIGNTPTFTIIQGRTARNGGNGTNSSNNYTATAMSNNHPNAMSTTTIHRNGRFAHQDLVHFEVTLDGQLRERRQQRTPMQQAGEEEEEEVTTATTTKIITTYHPLQVNFTYDNYPTEVAWMVSNLDRGERMFVSKSGDVLSAGLVSVNLQLPHGSYWMIVLDSAGDGICCGYGEGSLKISKINHNSKTTDDPTTTNHDEWKTVVDHGGEYGARAEFFFDLP